jgi:hypothetical protein
MTVTEILRYYDVENIAPYAPFIYKCLPSRKTTADWWIDILGGEDLTVLNVTINPKSVLYDSTTQYDEVDSYNDLLDGGDSFYFDYNNQILYIHTDIEAQPAISELETGVTTGYTNNSEFIYIDDVPYKNLLLSTLSLEKEADLADYNQLAFLSGDQVFDNTSGEFDEIIDNNIYGNDVTVYYLETVKDKNNYSRDELDKLATFYVEDYEHSLREFTLTLQDKRKAQNIGILDDDNEIPRIYGTIKKYEPEQISDDDIWSPTFRLGYNLTDIGTVEVKGDYGWVVVTPFEINYDAGTFRIPYSQCRKDGETDGTVLPIRVREFTGMVNASALDVIVDLVGLPYNATNYDLTAWEAARAVICPIDIVFDKQTELYDAIQTIQNGCNVGFRYDFTKDGKRTILLDDFSKDSVAYITRNRIVNNMTIPVSTNSELLAAKVKINYDYDNIEDEYTTHTDSSKYNEVLKKYRQAPSLEFTVYTDNLTYVYERAEFALERYGDVERTVKLELMGSIYYDLEIYDIITVELGMENQRTFYGTWKAQIVGVAPDTSSGTNSITALLIERV